MNISANGIPYALKEAFKNIKINGLMSTASVFVLLACLVIMGSSVLLTSNINRFISKIEGQNEIVLFLNDENTAEQNATIGSKLRQTANVSEVNFVSKEQAFDEYKSEFGDEAGLLEGLKENNPLRNAYHIKIANLKKYDETLFIVKDIEGIAKIRDKREIVNKILKLREVLTFLSIWIVGILLFMSLFIISNTVRIAMYTRKLEINIMKFVGATDNFIRLPFLVEGFILGVLSGMVATLLQWFVYSKIIAPLLIDLSLFKPLLFGEVGFKVFGFFVLAGMFVGALGSILPMRKYLKV